MRDQQAHGLWRESRGQGPALKPPASALAEEQSCADQGAQDAQGGIRATIVLVLVDEHAPDRLGCVQEKARASEKASLNNLFVVGSARINGDAVRSHPTRELERPHAVGGWFGHWGDEQVCPRHCRVNHPRTLQIVTPVRGGVYRSRYTRVA